MSKRLRKVRPNHGWVLVAEDDSGERVGWYICWDEIFGTRKSALKFATDHNWPARSYRAVRGTLSAQPV